MYIRVGYSIFYLIFGLGLLYALYKFYKFLKPKFAQRKVNKMKESLRTSITANEDGFKVSR